MSNMGVVDIGVGLVGEDCLREVEVVDEDYQMKVKVVAEGCLLDEPTHFGTYHCLGFDY